MREKTIRLRRPIDEVKVFERNGEEEEMGVVGKRKLLGRRKETRNFRKCNATQENRTNNEFEEKWEGEEKRRYGGDGA